MAEVLTPMRRQILEFIVSCQRERGFPPTIREIGEEVGLSSSATVANHITVLKNAGYIEKNAQQPRTLTVRLETATSAAGHDIRYIPLVGDIAAGSGVLGSETSHEMMPVPEQFAGRGDSFMLQVRGDSMVNAGILSGDFIVVARQNTANSGEIVVAGIPGDEATVKRFFRQGSRIILKPENLTMEPMDFDSREVAIYGRVISVLRRY